MQTKKQQLIFKGLDRTGKEFFTSSLESAIIHSTVDPVPMNRKSRKAMPKLIKKLTR